MPNNWVIHARGTFARPQEHRETPKCVWSHSGINENNRQALQMHDIFVGLFPSTSQHQIGQSSGKIWKHVKSMHARGQSKHIASKHFGY